MPCDTDRSRDRLSILLLCDERPSHAPNVLEHIRAFRQFSRHRVEVFNPCGLTDSRLLRLSDYDVVVLHYTIFVLSDNYLSPWFREQVALFSGLKIQFIQDEYRQVDAMAARTRELGVHVLFSSVPAEAVPVVYGGRLPGVDVLTTLTGYVPAELEPRPRQPLNDRPLDVVYRGRAIPYWLGRLGQEKVAVGREFLSRASSTGLRCDVAWTEADRIYGDQWYRFLGSSRTTLGTESGASIVDFDGSLQERTESYLKAHPAAPFDEVEREILSPYEGNAVIQTVSPRVFESAALGTAMINFTGRYSDIIEPWTHYVPLEKDFSNFDDVVAAIRNDAVLERIASRAHADLVASGRYSLRAFVEEFDREVAARARPATRSPTSSPAQATRRALLALEQFWSPARRAQLPVVTYLRARATGSVGRRLIRRFPEIEKLAKSRAGNDEKLLRDLVRLAAAAAAHLRELSYLGPPFDVHIEFDAEAGRLMLVGVGGRPQDASELDRLKRDMETAILEDRLQEIIWDNHAVTASFRFLSVPVSSLEVGYHVVTGAHRFTALEKRAREDPEGVIAALAPLFRRRPDEPVNELDRRTALLAEMLLRPLATAARGTASLRSALTTRELRRLLLAYLASPAARAEVPVHLLLKDLLRLRLLGDFRTSVELVSEGKTLVYRTERTDAGNGVIVDAATVRTVEQIVWDHSAVGSLVTSKQRPHFSVTLEEGRHTFEALRPLTRHFPELVVSALRRAATPG